MLEEGKSGLGMRLIRGWMVYRNEIYFQPSISNYFVQEEVKRGDIVVCLAGMFSCRENEATVTGVATVNTDTTPDTDKKRPLVERGETEVGDPTLNGTQEEEGSEVTGERDLESPTNSGDGRECNEDGEKVQDQAPIKPGHKQGTSILTSKLQPPWTGLQSCAHPPPLAPKLSSADDFLLESDDALTVEVPASQRQVSGVEQLQQRFVQHTQSLRPKMKSLTQQQQQQQQGKEEGENDGGGGGGGSKGTRPLVPEEVVSQLMNKPGQH